MSKFIGSIIILLFLLGIAFITYDSRVSYFDGVKSYFANLFFSERISPIDLEREYRKGGLSVLIIPGHDNNSPGTEFGNIYETHLNVSLGYYLYEYLEKDEKFNVIINRDRNGAYSAWYENYISSEGPSIELFRKTTKHITSNALKDGDLHKLYGVQHNEASDKTSFYLYGINKWANDNNIEIVIHIHHNDYPRRAWNMPGKYTGFSIYVPDKQLPNSRASIEVAESIKNQLEQFTAKSDLPGEADTIVYDQELIAIGSNASRNGASILIEYGYIYETQFQNEEINKIVAKELAYQTYSGLKKYFEKITIKNQESFDTTLLPFNWAENLRKGSRGLDVLSAQMALVKEGYYPPIGKSFNLCPLSGYFGNCTSEAIKKLQLKMNNNNSEYSIPSAEIGFLGPETRSYLNSIYGDI